MTSLKQAWRGLTKYIWGRKNRYLTVKYDHFQKLLAASNKIMTLMADMEEKFSGDYLFDLQYIFTSVTQIRTETLAMVNALNDMSGNHYQSLTEVSHSIIEELEERLYKRQEIPKTSLVIFFNDIDANMVEIVGAKNANLGEVRNSLNLPVPNGFAISSYAYKVFLDHNDLPNKITRLLESQSLQDLGSLERLSGKVKEIIRQAEVPPDLETALHEAFGQLVDLEDKQPLVAMRPSSISDDLTFSEANQYATFLNIAGSHISAHYKDIVASFFTPRALFHYKNKGFKEEEMAMGITVMTMIKAAISGVLFSRSPQSVEEAALINAVWGVGSFVGGGLANSDQYLVAYHPAGKILEQTIAPKKAMLVCRPDAGIIEVPINPKKVSEPCLTEPLVNSLLEWAVLLEEHFGRPQDVSWIQDYDGKLWFLQCRPLQVALKKETHYRTFKKYQVLLDQGEVAYRGIGAGPVFLVTKEEDLKDFPPGSVLVIKHTSPKYTPIIPQAAAIITDFGSITGHMALVAREFQVPTILNTGRATQVLHSGQQVTVDANYNNVYAGIITELSRLRQYETNGLADSPVFRTLKAVLNKVIPLNLINPQSESFVPEGCRTIHDLVRCAHEFSMRELFKLTEGEGQTGRDIVALESGLPFRVRLLDLGGGVTRGWRRKVRLEQITSIPFKAFGQGLMTMPGPQAKSEGGQGVRPDSIKSEKAGAQGPSSYRDQSYAVLSRNYLNCTILGNHLSTLEAYVSEQVNDNYITLLFRAGDATLLERQRRARLMEVILERLELSCQRRGDLIEARFVKYPREHMTQRLLLLGKLISYAEQLDVVLSSEEKVDGYIKDFLEESGGQVDMRSQVQPVKG